MALLFLLAFVIQGGQDLGFDLIADSAFVFCGTGGGTGGICPGGLGPGMNRAYSRSGWRYDHGFPAVRHVQRPFRFHGLGRRRGAGCRRPSGPVPAEADEDVFMEGPFRQMGGKGGLAGAGNAEIDTSTTGITGCPWMCSASPMRTWT